jgi:O-6-methylguanine DNA methyltransferase
MGTVFQEKVWAALRLIPAGHVTTYGEIARYLGTDAVRAVGTAVGKNPDAPNVPCHRVVPATGKIGHYSGGEGTSTKMALLIGEGVLIEKGKIVGFDQVFWRFNQQSTSPSGS